MLDHHPIPYERLISFAAGDLGETDSANIEMHIAGCARCTATVTRYRKVSNVFSLDDTFDAPPATIARAQALFPRYRPIPQVNSRPAFGWWSWRSVGFAYATVAVVCVLFMVGLLAVAGDAPEDSALYPVRTAVQGLELRFSNALRNLGLAVPLGLPTGAPSDPGTQGSPGSSPAPSSPGNPPPGQINVPPGQAKTPPGQIKVPPGQAKTPPGQINVPPGQLAKTPPAGQVTPTPTKQVPPGQLNKTPDQANPTPDNSVPPGQLKKTPQSNPGGQSNPNGQGNPGQGNSTGNSPGNSTGNSTGNSPGNPNNSK
jgi:hypothetical protein